MSMPLPPDQNATPAHVNPALSRVNPDLTAADVERWYAHATHPRQLAYKAVWLRLVEGKTTPAVWRTVDAALDAYEGALVDAVIDEYIRERGQGARDQVD